MRTRSLAVLVIIILALVGCNAPTPVPPTVTATVTNTPIHIPTVLPPTVTLPASPTTSVLPTAAPTLAPTSVPPTTAPSGGNTGGTTGGSTSGTTGGGSTGGTTGGSSGSPRPDVSKATRISFPAGGTYGNASGTLNANTTASYVVGVSQGQLMEVGVSSTAVPKMKIIGADGTVIMNGNGEVYRGVVPSTQDYVIQLTQGGTSAAFSMQITIPERINFDAGTTNKFVQANLKANDMHHYILKLQANQVMELTFASEAGIRTSIFGIDGDVLKTSSVGGPSYRGKVRTTQDYIVQVITDATPVNYTMNVVIPARITFDAGATSATLTGSLAAQRVIYYVFGAAANQQLDIVFTPAGSAKMTIYGIDGTVLSSGMGEGTTFSGKLPITQDYFLVFQTGTSAVNNYTLKITIK